MVILFKTAKLEKECNNENLPQARCHELKGNRKGQLSVDLDHPYRLIFEPANNPIPEKSDGGLEWNNVTKVRIIGMEDTHE
ncbi:MAG: killer suppression protein [Nitrospirae bacterium]|nr:killer suppression protein [Nitrospirota bacterium]